MMFLSWGVYCQSKWCLGFCVFLQNTLFLKLFLYLQKILQKKKAKVSYFDPYFPYLKINGIDLVRAKIDKNSLKKFDCALVVTDNSGIDYAKIAKTLPLILDTRNIYGRLGIKSNKVVKI